MSAVAIGATDVFLKIYPIVMILAIAVALSIVIVTFSYIKNNAFHNKDEWFGQNIELDKFYAFSDLSVTQMQKQLMSAAVVTVRRIKELESERYALYNLAQDRIVSHGLWKLWDRTMKDLELEKMIIASEADALKADWSNTIFKEASAAIMREKRDTSAREKRSGESLFRKKRETLEKRILAKLMSYNDTKPVHSS